MCSNIFCLGLGNYKLRPEYSSQTLPVDDMTLIPSIPLDDIAARVKSKSDVDIDSTKECDVASV